MPVATLVGREVGELAVESVAVTRFCNISIQCSVPYCINQSLMLWVVACLLHPQGVHCRQGCLC
jgi:hypothetical protein